VTGENEFGNQTGIPCMAAGFLFRTRRCSRVEQIEAERRTADPERTKQAAGDASWRSGRAEPLGGSLFSQEKKKNISWTAKTNSRVAQPHKNRRKDKSDREAR
jgi:hypothetical protein